MGKTTENQCHSFFQTDFRFVFGEAQVLKSFNHQKSFHRVWDVYDEMIREKAGKDGEFHTAPVSKGGAEHISSSSHKKITDKSFKSDTLKIYSSYYHILSINGPMCNTLLLVL